MIHRYEVDVTWIGNRGSGTAGYRAYGRDFECRTGAKPVLAGSADPHFLGDADRWNPEDLLVASLSACHQLWYLHLCADAGVVVRAYRDRAEGIMTESSGGEGEFTSVTLRPRVTLAADADVERARALHAKASASCFIARSVAFPVHHEPEVVVEVAPAAALRTRSESQAISPADARETIDRYCAVWSCPDARARAERLDAIWGTGAAYTDPSVRAVGAEELLAHIARVHDTWPDIEVARHGPVDAHHRTARFRWRAVDGQGGTLVDGLDVVTFLDDGRLADVVGFFEDGGGETSTGQGDTR